MGILQPSVGILCPISRNFEAHLLEFCTLFVYILLLIREDSVTHVWRFSDQSLGIVHHLWGFVALLWGFCNPYLGILWPICGDFVDHLNCMAYIWEFVLTEILSLGI